MLPRNPTFAFRITVACGKKLSVWRRIHKETPADKKGELFPVRVQLVHENVPRDLIDDLINPNLLYTF